MIKVIKWEPVLHEKVVGQATIVIERWDGSKYLCGYFVDGITYWNVKGKKFVTLPSKTIKVDGKKKYIPTEGFLEPEINKKYIDSIKLAIDNYLLNEDKNL